MSYATKKPAAKRATKTQRKVAEAEQVEEINSHKLKSIQCKTQKQRHLYNSCLENPMVFALGPAGTGKSYSGAYAACRMLVDGKIDKIILTRNPLPLGESLGFFAGTEEEKMTAWLGPIVNTLKKILKTANGTDGYFKYLVENEQIVYQPMEVCKGLSVERTYVIVEEAQECTMEQLKTLTTRIGEDSFIFLNGDIEQSNTRYTGKTGLAELVEAVEKENAYYTKNATEDWDKIEIPVYTFNESEIVRSGITRKMVNIFNRHNLKA